MTESLEVIRLAARQLTDHVAVTPFAPTDGFEERWWCNSVFSEDRSDRWFAFRDESGADLVRAEVRPGSTVGSMYAGVIVPPQGWTEIQFLEVREDRRGAGLGRRAVQLLLAEYPGTTFAAFSEQADEFWSSLGWTGHERSVDAHHYRTLFIGATA